MTDIFIEGGRTLLGNEIQDTSLLIAGREIRQREIIGEKAEMERWEPVIKRANIKVQE